MEVSPPPQLLVIIHLKHSTEFASQYLSNQYPASFTDLLEQTAPSASGMSQPATATGSLTERDHDAVLSLPGTSPPSSPLSIIRRDLGTAFRRVPIYPGWCFRSHGAPSWEQDRGEFTDSQTIGSAWRAIHEREARNSARMAARGHAVAIPDGTQADEIHLVIATTAGHLQELDGALAMAFRRWKRCVVGLSYLQHASGDEGARDEIEELKALERQRGELRCKFNEWQELVSGAVVRGPRLAKVSLR